MNFVKNKRKADREHEEDIKEIQPASQKSRLVSIVKKVGENIRFKVTLALNAFTGRSYTHGLPSALLTTLTPLEPFREKKTTSKWR